MTLGQDEFFNKIVNKNLKEIYTKIIFDHMETVGLIDEFIEFIDLNLEGNVYEILREFSKLHPSKLHFMDECDQYSKFIDINKTGES